MGLLRTLLAISVIFAHTRTLGLWGWTGVGGEIAVQCFYMVSGFFISLILNEKYLSREDTKKFYINRGIRIYSLYFLCLFIYLPIDAVGYVVVHKGTIAFWVENLGHLRLLDTIYLFLANIFLFGLDWTAFLRIGEHGLQWTKNFHLFDPGVYNLVLIPQAWTLGVELTFYALAPFIVRQRTGWIIVIFCMSLGARIMGHFFGLQSDPWSYRFFPFELSMFLAGTIAYRAYRAISDIPIPAFLRRASVLALASVILYQLYASPNGDDFFAPSRIALFIILLLCLPLLFLQTKDNAMDRFIGELSYPIYLVHAAILRVIDNSAYFEYGKSNTSKFVIFVIVVVLSILIAKYIEIPINRVRQRIARAKNWRAGIDVTVNQTVS